MSRSHGSRFPPFSRGPPLFGRAAGRNETPHPGRGLPPPPPQFRAPTQGRGRPGRGFAEGQRPPIQMMGAGVNQQQQQQQQQHQHRGQHMPPRGGGREMMRGRHLIGSQRGMMPPPPPPPQVVGRGNPPPPPPPRGRPPHLLPPQAARGHNLSMNRGPGRPMENYMTMRAPAVGVAQQQQFTAGRGRLPLQGVPLQRQQPPPPPPPPPQTAMHPTRFLAPHPNQGLIQTSPLPNQRVSNDFPLNGISRPQYPNLQPVATAPFQAHRSGTPPVVARAPVAAAASTTITSTSTTFYTPAQIAAAWTEHKSPQGVSYFYNALTKESTYDKPNVLQTAAHQVVVSGNKLATTTTSPTITKTSGGNIWIEYTDAATGKKYYSNGITTTWEKPTSSLSNDNQPTTTPRMSSAAATTTTTGGGSLAMTVKVDSKNDDDNDGSASSQHESSASPARKKQKTAGTNKQMASFSSKAEAIAAFKGLLIAKDVSPTLKWNEVVKLYSNHSRWQACEDVLTTGERKQALSEYQTKRANELRQQEREEKLRARQAFYELLNEVVPKAVTGFSAWNTRYEHVRDVLATDDRFHVVADEATRESLFLDFCEDFRKREERKKRSIKRETQENFISFLKEKEDEGLLSFASTWNSFVAGLNEEAKEDSRFVISQAMSDSDRQLYFADHVIALQAAEDEKRRRIRDARRRAEQAQRDAYRESLHNLAADGKIFPWSLWRDVQTIVSAEASYGPMHEQAPEVPRDLFEEFVDEWHDRYRHDRVLLVKLTHPTKQTQLVVNADTSYETFSNALLETASGFPELLSDARVIMSRSDPVSSARVFFHEMKDKGRSEGRAISRRGSALHHRDAESSEDEGEIIEDGEVNERGDPVSEEENGGLKEEDKPSQGKNVLLEECDDPTPDRDTEILTEDI